MFERPLGLALLLLVLPWIAWARRGHARRWPVGGLEPFRELPRARGGLRRWPASLWAGLLALGCGALALAGPRWGGSGSLLLEDWSLSALGGVYPPAESQPDAVRIGARNEPVAEAEIFDALRIHGLAQHTTVVSDRPRPIGTPAAVTWRNPWSRPFAGNAAILSAWEQDGGWRVHWARWNLPGALDLVVEPPVAGTPLRLSGEEGTAELGPIPHGAWIGLSAGEAGAEPFDPPADDFWRAPGPLDFDLPAGADPRWAQALRAALPGISIGGGSGPPVPIRFALQTQSEGIVFQGDPFARRPELEAVAEIGEKLAPLAQELAGLPRPRSECEPPGAPVAWPEDLQGPAGGSGRSAWLLAGLGFLLYLLALGLRVCGK